MNEIRIKTPSGDVWGVSLQGKSVEITLYKRTVPGRGILRRELVPLEFVKWFYHEHLNPFTPSPTSRFSDLAITWKGREAKSFAVVLGEMYRAVYGEYVEALTNE